MRLVSKCFQRLRRHLLIAVSLGVSITGCRDAELSPPAPPAEGERGAAFDDSRRSESSFKGLLQETPPPRREAEREPFRSNHSRLKPDRAVSAEPGSQKISEAGPEPHLSLLIWEQYLTPGIIERFEAKTGATVAVTEVENSEELKQRIAAAPAAFDVVVADEKTLGELIALRLLRPLDTSLLGEQALDIETFLSSPTDSGVRYSIPYLWGLTVLAARSGLFDEHEASWSLLWREDLRIAVLDEPLDLVWLALLSLGHDPAKATKMQIDEAADRIAKRFPKLTDHMMDVLSGLDALESGEIDLMVTYNGDALSRAAGNADIEVALPKEGAPLWMDSFAVASDAPSPRLAHRFIKFMSSPEVSAETSSSLFYATPNPQARAALSPSLLQNPVLYPAAAEMERCTFMRFDPAVEKHLHQTILRLISGNGNRRVAMERRRDGTLEERPPKESLTED